MNILVTGGAGYIGMHIVDLLCNNGYKVIVYDNLSSGYKENLNIKAKFVLGDICNNEELNKLFQANKIDCVIHMAALKSVNKSITNTEEYTRVNIQGSLNLISTSLKYNVEKFIFSSTAAVYGIPEYTPIDENHRVCPINHYGFTKLYVEKYLEWISKISTMRFVSLRYFNAAGYTSNVKLVKYKEKNPENLLPIVMQVANNTRKFLNVNGNNYDTKDGTCIRDYIHVMDLSDAHIKAIDFLKNSNSSITLNLSYDTGYSIIDVINLTEKIVGYKINYNFVDRREGDPGIVVSSSHKAKDILNWYPRKSDLKIILESMWNVYKK